MTEQQQIAFDLLAAINATDGASIHEIALTVRKGTRVMHLPSEDVEEEIYIVKSHAMICENGLDRIIARYYEIDNSGLIMSRFYDNKRRQTSLVTVTSAIIHGYYYVY